MFEPEREILKFGFDLVETQSIGQRCIDVKCLSGNLVLLVGWLGSQCAHIMEAVADLDENYADVITHGEQQFLEVLCLCRSLFTKNTTGDFRQAINNLCYFGSENVGNIFHSVVGVLHHIVEQGRADTRRTKSHLLTGYLGHGDGVHDVRLTRKAFDSLVRLTCKIESLGDDVHLLAMAGSQITVKQSLEGFINHLFTSQFFGGNLILLLVHSFNLNDNPCFAGYFTRSFLPARILLPLMPLSLRNLSTVVWFLRAICESVCPSLMVTFCSLTLRSLRPLRPLTALS